MSVAVDMVAESSLLAIAFILRKHRPRDSGLALAIDTITTVSSRANPQSQSMGPSAPSRRAGELSYVPNPALVLHCCAAAATTRTHAFFSFAVRFDHFRCAPTDHLSRFLIFLQTTAPMQQSSLPV